jgi:hypothetical protein
MAVLQEMKTIRMMIRKIDKNNWDKVATCPKVPRFHKCEETNDIAIKL